MDNQKNIYKKVLPIVGLLLELVTRCFYIIIPDSREKDVVQ
jgi:hypothetical protein